MNLSPARFSIEQAERFTGVSQTTLRNWENRYQAIMPERTESGRRVYRLEQLIELKAIRQLHQAQSISLKSLFDLAKAGLALPEVEPSIPSRIERQIESCYEHLIQLDHREGNEVLNNLYADLAEHEFIDWVCNPIFKKLGVDWSEQRIEVYQEHFASAVLRTKLYHILSRPVANKAGAPVILATTGSELHEGALLSIACSLHLRGRAVVYMGTGLPIEDLKKCAQKIRPAAIGLSFISDCPQQDLAALSEMEANVVIGGGAVSPQSSVAENVLIFRGSIEDGTMLMEVLIDS